MSATRSVLGVVAFSLWILPTAGGDDTADRAKLRTALLERERVSWDLLKKKDVPGMRAFYPDDLLMVTSTGERYGKARFLKEAPDLHLTEYAIQGTPDLVVLTPDAAVLVYKVTYTLGVKDAKPKAVTALSSSTYARRGGIWVMVFNQESPAP